MKEGLKRIIRQFLLRIQPYARTDMVYLARGGFWSTANFFASSLFSGLLIIAFGNFLPKETYGNYKFIMSLAGTLGFLMFIGINTAVIRAAAQGKIGVLAYSIRLQLRWNFIFTAAMGMVSIYYLVQNNTLFAVALGLLALGVPLISTFNTYGAFLSGRKEFKRLAMYSSLTTLFYSMSMCGAIILSTNIIVIVFAYILGSLLPLLYFHRQVTRDLPLLPLTPGEKNEIVSYAKHLNIMNILGNLSQYVDKIVVFHYLGAIQLAVYGFALAIPERIRGYLKSITGLALPKLSERSIADITRNFYRRIFQGILVGALISASYIILAPPVFKLVLPKYLDAVHYSQVIALSFILLLPGTYIGDIFRSQKMIRALYLSSLGGHLTKIILFVVLGTLWGIWGVIIASQTVIVLGFFYNIIIWEIEKKRIVPTYSEVPAENLEF